MSSTICESDIAMQWSGIMKLLSLSFQSTSITSNKNFAKFASSGKIRIFYDEENFLKCLHKELNFIDKSTISPRVARFLTGSSRLKSLPRTITPPPPPPPPLAPPNSKSLSIILQRVRSTNSMEYLGAIGASSQMKVSTL